MGFLVTIISAFCSTAKDIVSKAVAGRIHPDVSTFASFLFALPFYLLVMGIGYAMGFETFSFSGSFLWLVVARSITDVFAESFKMKAFASGDLSLVSSFIALSPIVLAFLSPIITGDRVTAVDIIALALIVGGGLLLIQRDLRSGRIFQFRAVLYALAASLAFALNSCFDRLAVMKSGPILSGFAMTGLAALFTLPLAARHSGARGSLKQHSRAFFLRGAFETLFMVTKLLAMTVLPAHVVVGGTRVSLVISVIAGRVWFGERNTARRLTAAACVYAGLLVLVFQHL
jgi:drug/metabolite transporter (DMT)-like permease